MPWIDASELSARWPTARRALRVLIYGKGVCGPDSEHFADFAKRLEIAELVGTKGHIALFAENELESDEPGWTLAEVELARDADLVIALQPLAPAKGPPSLKMELADLSHAPEVRERVLIFRPDDESFAFFEDVLTRFPSENVFAYPAERYESCEFTTDMVCGAIEVYART